MNDQNTRDMLEIINLQSQQIALLRDALATVNERLDLLSEAVSKTLDVVSLTTKFELEKNRKLSKAFSKKEPSK